MTNISDKNLYELLQHYSHVDLIERCVKLLGSYNKLAIYLQENSLLTTISERTIYTWKTRTKKIRPIIKYELLKVIEKFESNENIEKFIEELKEST